MKTTFSSHSEVCHVWTQNNQALGKSGNIFFEEDTIFSYGKHYWLGYRIASDIVFINSSGYSVSTAKHTSLLRRAVSHLTIFEVPTRDDHKINLEYLVEEATKERNRLLKARTHTSEVHLDTLKKQVRSYAERFTYGSLKLWAYGVINELTLSDDAKIKIKEQEQWLREKNKREKADKLVLETVDLEKWMKGESTNRYFTQTRLRVNGDMVETSKGAKVTSKEAKVLYKLIRAEKPVHGFKIGYYQVTSCNSKKLVVGCHNIPMSEIHRIGDLLSSEI